MEEIYESEARSAGDLAGIFEFDGEVSYFYLYSIGPNDSLKTVATLWIGNGDPDFKATDVTIRWDPREEFVGLFIRDQLRAAFDAAANAYGPATPESPLPLQIQQRLGAH